MDEQSIFMEALQRESSKDRADFLDQACGGDTTLRAQVVELLAAHDQVGNFLRKEAQLNPTADRNGSGLSGTSIGPYKLREPLGTGGFGVVWAAEQTEPVHRKVAVKIIKPGMETRDVIARFEAERQALAMMDHENIARVIDAGTTESGHPYFVMELIRGVPITEYCDTNKLTLTERLRLFSQVCRAVQHAHQKGIIHRDVKPSNVLVTLHDGRPVPKVIDFGISKALNQRLTDKTIYTRVHQAIGTLAYMSPEQAELSGLDVDTRADVYGLGILAYELLTGSTPFDSQRLNEAALHEACRIIREEEPPRASIKVSSLGATATAVSEQRRTQPQELAQKLHGDLDWILVKALEKDRTRRYESASAFAADVERYLNNEPIEARPPTVAYRLRKFASRHRGGLAISGVILTALVVALVMVTILAVNQRRSLQALREESVKRAIVAALLGDTTSAEDGLRVAGETGDRGTEIMTLEGLIALNKGNYEEAVEHAQKILEIDEEHIGGLAILVYAQIWQGDIDESVMHNIRLAEVEPKTELEHLLIAYGLVLYDSDTAMKWLSKVPRIQGSPVGLLVRAQDNLFRGEDDEDYDLFLKAVQDIEYAHYLMPGSPGAEAWHATTLAHTIEFARNKGYECDALIRKGQDILSSLSKSGRSPFDDIARWKLCRALNKPNEAWNAIRRAGSNAVYCWDLSVECIMRHDSTIDAERAFTEVLPKYSQENKYRQIALAFLVHDGEDGAERVRGLVKEYADDPSSLVRMLASFALCLAGDLKEVEAFARCGSHFPDRGTPRFANDECLSFLAHPNSVAEKEKLVEAATSNSYAHINAYMTIAMTCLAKHDRKEAKKNLETCTSKTAIGNFSYEMARALLSRMDADPDWPRWCKTDAAP